MTKTNASKKSVVTSARGKKKGKHKLPMTNTLDLMNLNKDSARDMSMAFYDYGGDTHSKKTLEMQFKPEILTL